MGKYLDIIRKAQYDHEPAPRTNTCYENDEINEIETRRVTPAESILETCLRHGIALRLDDDGSLRIGKADGSGREPTLWPSLLMAIETHLEAVTALVAAGWHLRSEIPKESAA